MTSKAPSNPSTASKSAASPPLRPRRGLFYALLGAFFLWIAVVLVLYFTTVRGKPVHYEDDRPATRGVTQTPPPLISGAPSLYA